jgi:hypothetical protein
MKNRLQILLLSLFTFSGFAQSYSADVIIYGGTSAAITAAVQVKQMGKTVIIVSPDKHLGGLTSGGLGYTDSGDKTVIGGLSKEFYQMLYTHYQSPEAWKWQRKDEFGNKGQGTVALDSESGTMWLFEPSVAEMYLEKFIADHQIQVLRNEFLLRNGKGIKKKQNSIESFLTESGKTFKGKMFIDVTYEGDLMAEAGVSYTIGREANNMYNENWNGVQKPAKHHGHYFNTDVDPYIIKGDSKSGLLPEISKLPPGEDGTGDKRL